LPPDPLNSSRVSLIGRTAAVRCASSIQRSAIAKHRWPVCGLYGPYLGRPRAVGWFSLQSVQRENETLRLAIAANNQLPPTSDDIRIIQRAKALLSDEKVWNREDNRTCPANPQNWSLFCALQQATQEISGGVHYRQPALQMVREVLNEVGGNRLGKHRLMDYNNHSDTTLTDVHSLLNTAQARLEKRLR
jgi:hypothetical protein